MHDGREYSPYRSHILQVELLRCLLPLVTGPNRLLHRWPQDSCYFFSLDQCQVFPRALFVTCKSQRDKIPLLFDLECSSKGLMHPSCTEFLRSPDPRLEYSLDQGSSVISPLVGILCKYTFLDRLCRSRTPHSPMIRQTKTRHLST